MTKRQIGALAALLVGVQMATAQVASAQPTEAPPPVVDSQSPPTADAPPGSGSPSVEQAPVAPDITNLPPAVLSDSSPPDPAAPVFQRTSTVEVTDTAEAEAIGNRIIENSSQGGNPSARLAGPSCLQTRNQSCGTYIATLDQFVQEDPRDPTLKYIGTWTIDMTLQARSPSRTDTRQSTIQYWAESKSNSPTTTLPGTFEFNLSVLRPDGAPEYFPPFVHGLGIGELGQGYTQFEYFTRSNAVTNIDVSALRYGWKAVTGAQQLNPPPADVTTSQRIRCDAAQAVNYGTGCVNPRHIPTQVVTEAQFPNVVLTVRQGQRNTNLGTPLGPNPLTRGPSSDNRENRDAACPRSSQLRLDALGSPPGNILSPSCDEYPYASTTQGGQGSTVNWVPLEENTRQGREIARFYRENRVMPGDSFYVNAYT